MSKAFVISWSISKFSSCFSESFQNYIFTRWIFGKLKIETFVCQDMPFSREILMEQKFWPKGVKYYILKIVQHITAFLRPIRPLWHIANTNLALRFSKQVTNMTTRFPMIPVFCWENNEILCLLDRLFLEEYVVDLMRLHRPLERGSWCHIH